MNAPAHHLVLTLLSMRTQCHRQWSRCSCIPLGVHLDKTRWLHGELLHKHRHGLGFLGQADNEDERSETRDHAYLNDDEDLFAVTMYHCVKTEKGEKKEVRECTNQNARHKTEATQFTFTFTAQ